MSNYTFADEERYVQDKGHVSSRGQFARDRARILHSSGLRRLGTKTQVMGAGFDDFVRTRLTHSLEVAQVGRDIARQLGCDQDIVDAACLAHDIGHPPFGHNGETALNIIAQDFGGFEGNAQTFRLLTRLEPKKFDGRGKSVGLNLSRATLDATIKYPWRRQLDNPKFGVYEDDLPIYDWVRSVTPDSKKLSKCIEAGVMDLADDISYSTHDIEDAFVANSFPKDSLQFVESSAEKQHLYGIISQWYGDNFNESELDDAIARLKKIGVLDFEYTGTRSNLASLKNMISVLIGRFADSACKATKKGYPDVDQIRYNACIIVPKKQLAEIQILKGISAAYVMAPIQDSQRHDDEQGIIFALFDKLKEGKGLDKAFSEDFENAQSDSERNRIVVDQIASLTDHSAREMSNSLIGAF